MSFKDEGIWGCIFTACLTFNPQWLVFNQEHIAEQLLAEAIQNRV